MTLSTSDLPSSPSGELALQTLAMPSDTNPHGDVFGGWLMSQMDIAGTIHANGTIKGRVTTVAVSGMRFIRPVPVGAIVSCYCKTEHIGNTSISVQVEVWIKEYLTHEQFLVTQGTYIYVALDDKGQKRSINNN